MCAHPVLKAAAQLGIPAIVHESNAVPGLTTKMLAGAVDRILVGFEESKQHYSEQDKVVVTGTPVRRLHSRPAPRRRPSASSGSTPKSRWSCRCGDRSARHT